MCVLHRDDSYTSEVGKTLLKKIIVNEYYKKVSKMGLKIRNSLKIF